MSSLRMEVMMHRGLRSLASRQKGRWPDSICRAGVCGGAQLETGCRVAARNERCAGTSCSRLWLLVTIELQLVIELDAEVQV